MIKTLVPNLNDRATLDRADEELEPGHIVAAINRDNDERTCAMVNSEGHFRYTYPAIWVIESS